MYKYIELIDPSTGSIERLIDCSDHTEKQFENKFNKMCLDDNNYFIIDKLKISMPHPKLK